MSVRHLVVSLAVILLAACSGPRNLPPVGTSDQARPATSSGPVPASAGVGAITIQPGGYRLGRPILLCRAIPCMASRVSWACRWLTSCG